MVLAYAVTVFAHYVLKTSIVIMLLYAYGAVVQFAPGLVAALYLRNVTGRGVLAGMIVGSAITVVLLIAPELMPVRLHAGLYGLVANTIVMLAMSRAAGGENAFLATCSSRDGG
jgi:SSS family solute:Na+ symporter